MPRRPRRPAATHPSDPGDRGVETARTLEDGATSDAQSKPATSPPEHPTIANTLRDERSFWSLERRARLWLITCPAILLVSTIPYLAFMAEPLRLLAFVPLSIALALFVRNVRTRRRLGRRERSEETRLEVPPLLPYNSGKHAWIGNGFTIYDRLVVGGSILVDESRVRIEGARGETLAEAPLEAVSVHPVAIWLGTGIRVDMGTRGSWYVQPYYAPSNIPTGRRAAKRLREAINTAQSKTDPDGPPAS